MGSIAVLNHFFVQVTPGFGAPFSQFQPERTLPYVVVAAAVWWLRRLRVNRTDSYEEMLKNSPGIAIDNSRVTYGSGHPTAVPAGSPPESS